MREMVSERVERFEADWERRKQETRFGFLIRPVTILVGVVVLVAGVIMIPLPGQGWLTVFLGVGILSLEVAWARNVLTWGVRVYDDFFDWYHRQPRPLKWTLIAGLIVLIWLVFLVLGWIWWALGGIDWATFFYQDWLGLERR